MRTKRYVLDTNTLVSALLFKDGKPGRVLALAKSMGTVVFSVETAYELMEVWERDKFDKYARKEKRVEALDSLFDNAELETVNESVRLCRDPDDDKFLALAIEVEAECIVTGDRDLLDLESVRGIPILNANEFLKRYSG